MSCTLWWILQLYIYHSFQFTIGNSFDSGRDGYGMNCGDKYAIKLTGTISLIFKELQGEKVASFHLLKNDANPKAGKV